jgi:ABC-type branched-subunit amino acid transport system substrate-binding protein
MSPALRRLPLLLLAPLLLGAGLSPQEERGRRIYVDSASPSGAAITASLGQGVEVEASAVPCASCHGRDGKGRPEGGVTPTDITWASLTKPYGVVHPSGRRHPPYDERSMRRALAMGFDPAGNELHVAMPRYRMTRQDMDDLVAYLKRLGEATDPGVGETTLRIGLLPPPPGPLEPMGRAVRAALTARFAAVNADGGLYGRRLELVTLEIPPGDRRAGVAATLQRQEVFAAAAAFLTGEEAGLAAAFQEARVPLIGPFTLHPREDLPLNRYVFHLLPGIESQARALVRFARENPGSGAPRPALLAPRDKDLDAAVETVGKACEGWAPPAVLRYDRTPFSPGELAAKLAGGKADPVVFLGSGAEAAGLARALEALGWRPHLLVTGAAVEASLFSLGASFGGRIYAALPAPAALEAPAAARYRALAEGHALPPEHLSAQLAALAAAEVLIEGLKRAGRDLDRESFVETLEGLRQLPTGYSPPVSFGAGRRLGSQGAYVYAVEPAGGLAPSGIWIDAE